MTRLAERPVALLSLLCGGGSLAGLARATHGVGIGDVASDATYGSLARAMRHRRWTRPAYELIIWLGFELGIAMRSTSARPNEADQSTAWRWPQTISSTAWRSPRPGRPPVNKTAGSGQDHGAGRTHPNRR